MDRRIALLCLPVLAACASPQSSDVTLDPAREAASVAAEATAPAGEGAGDYLVTFRDRTIDLEPHVQGFPYGGFEAHLDGGDLLYFASLPGGTELRRVPISDRTFDLVAGERWTAIDWSTRSWFGARYHAPTERYVIWSDENNNERMNLYTLDPADGTVTALTDNDYTYGFGFSPDGGTLAYVRRTGTEAPFSSCLHTRDLASGDDREVVCDGGGADQFTWTNILFHPNGEDVLVSIQHDGDRTKENVARVRLTDTEPELEFLLERGIEHVSLWALDDTYDGDTVLVVSSVDGYANLYRLTLSSNALTPLTTFEADLSSVDALDDGTGRLVAVIRHPWESEVLLLDASGAVLDRSVRPTAVSLLDADGDTVLLRESSVDGPFELLRGEVAGDALALASAGGVPESLNAQIIGCNARRVSFPTFDALEDGSPRMLHAWFLEPSEPVAPEDRLVRITSFYGGGNTFSSSAQIMCQAGVATFSPAVRGSSGFGAAFSRLNDGDLGGDEIVDLFYAARWLEAEAGYLPEQIGVNGGSHGGYATMRALTFPPETNGRNDSYPFGFGMSHAGFSNILTFFETCNIPDWVILEAGDPATESEKLLDRSPISHVQRLDAPLLLTHGENDWRVPVAESRTFAEAASALGKPVTYVEFAGQGHGIQGLDNVLTYYRTIFAFLASLDAE